MVWFGLDLRLGDNPALARVLARHQRVLPVFVWAPEEEAPWDPGAASRWWLHQSLCELDASLVKRGSKLIVRRGPTVEALLALAAESGARSVFWNGRYEPAAIVRERKIELHLRAAGIETENCPGNLLFEPGTVLNRAGKPFQVFTAFWRACLAMPDPAEIARVPARLHGPSKWPTSLAISDLELEPEIDWAGGLRETWRPGENGASRRLRAFLDRGLAAYSRDRDPPGLEGSSRLSPHLHFGEISVREIWRQVRRACGNRGRWGRAAAEAYLRQLAWREFSYLLLFHFPATAEQPLHPEFGAFPWRADAQALKAWTRGQTGYPLVDAGMRELWQTGWMHNRVRMVAASFLVKHLLIPWQEGAAWFWDTLVDADLANNTMGWQWSAGCGADAAPYFRIFNPVSQAERFDPDGEYVRRWVPELAQLPNKWMHRVWEAPAAVLAEAGVDLGKSYPRPLVEHAAARKRALDAWARMRGRVGAKAGASHAPARLLGGSA